MCRQEYCNITNLCQFTQHFFWKRFFCVVNFEINSVFYILHIFEIHLITMCILLTLPYEFTSNYKFNVNNGIASSLRRHYSNIIAETTRIDPWRYFIHDCFRVDNYSAHVLIFITFAVLEYLDTVSTTENKILRFSSAVLPDKTRSSSVILALILFFQGQTS